MASSLQVETCTENQVVAMSGEYKSAKFVSAVLALLASLVYSHAFAGVTDWVPFEMFRGHIMINAEIDGHPVKALLDSGAEGFGIHEDFLAEHGQHFKRGMNDDKVLVTGITGTHIKHPVYDVPIRLFGSEFNLDYVVPGAFGPYDLLIGQDFFNFSIVQIDYPNKRMRLVTRDAMELKKFANAKVRRPGNRGAPLVKVDINGDTRQWLMMDTGSNGGLYLPRWMAEKNGWIEKYPLEPGQSFGVSGRSVATERFIMPRLTFGPYTLEDIPVTVPARGEPDVFGGSRSGEPSFEMAKGLIGYDVLKHFVFTMDLKKKQLHIGLDAE